MIIKLSILVCTTPKRTGDGTLNDLIVELERQANGLPVEVLYLGDLANDNAMEIGEKRNALEAIKRGLYRTSADDDDIAAANYVNALLAVIESEEDPDAICFRVRNAAHGIIKEKETYFSTTFKHGDRGTHYERTPNHVMCVRSSIANQVKFAPISHGEDTMWANDILPLLTSEIQIPEVLYTYKADIAKSEAFRRNMEGGRTIRQTKGVMDVGVG